MWKTGTSKTFIEKYKYLILLVFFMILGVSMMMLPAWLNGEMFVGGGDIKTQWDPFYTLNRRETIDALRQGKLPFYSWILFLGTNLWASKASYGLFDPFNIATYPLGVSYLYIYQLLCFVKMITGALGMYACLRYTGVSKKHSFLGGLLYGLSSYSVYFTSEFGFLSFYVLLPFYFLGLERWLKEGRRDLFILSVFVLFLVNYYLFFAVTMLTPVFFLYRYYRNHSSLKGWFLSALRLIIGYLAGFLLAGAVIVPVVYFILQNSRVGSSGLVWTYDDPKVYLHLLISTLVPSHTFIYGNNVFEHSSHNMKEICFFASSLTALLVPQVLKSEKKIKMPVLIVYGIFFLIAFVSPLGSLLNGLSGASFRWSMAVIFLSVFISMEILDRGEIDQRLLLKTCIFEVVLIIAAFLIAVLLRGESVSAYPKQIAELLMAIGFSFLYVFLLKKGNGRILSIAVCAELFLFAGIFGFRVKGTKMEDYVKARNVIANSADKNDFMNNMNYLEEGNDLSFYRVYVPYESLYWTASRNMNLYYNLPGVMTYDSTYEPSFNEMKYLGNIPSVQIIDWEFSVQDPDILDFLSVKYALTLNEEEIPFADYEILTTDYRGFVTVSKNTGAKAFGGTYTEVLSKDEFNGDVSLLRDKIITERPEEIRNWITSKERSEMTDVVRSSNMLSGEIDSDGQGYVVLSLPYDRGWKIKVNGAEVRYDEVNCGFTGFKIPEGHSHIEMYFVPEGFKTGALMSVSGLIVSALIILWDHKRRKTS
ncbi:MAG: YfhO family protein [Erysipelotrichaceae bacterium]|nr:YfhO family protein [Erysipelotrichaceae bacterium]